MLEGYVSDVYRLYSHQLFICILDRKIYYSILKRGTSVRLELSLRANGCGARAFSALCHHSLLRYLTARLFFHPPTSPFCGDWPSPSSLATHFDLVKLDLDPPRLRGFPALPRSFLSAVRFFSPGQEALRAFTHLLLFHTTSYCTSQ